MENKGYIAAIDLGTNTVSVVIGLPLADGRMRIIDCETGLAEGMMRSEIKNIEQVSQSIKKVLQTIESRQRIRISHAFVGISGQHIRCVQHPYYVFVGRDGEIRENDVRKLHDSMANVPAPDGETIIQIIPQNYLVDQEETSSPVGAFGNKLEATFNFVLGDTSAINRIRRVLERVEVRQAGLFLNAIASAEAVTTEDEREEGVVVIDIGGGTTDVVVFYKKIVRHLAIIPLGGNAINKDIRSYGILERHVENLKVKYGSAYRDKAPSDKFITTPGLNARVPKEISFQNLAAIIEARMLDIIDYAMEQIKISGYTDRLGAGVVLTGGAARIKDLDTLFKDHTGLDVRIASPDVILDEESVEAVRDAAYATAVGLLLKGVMSRKQIRNTFHSSHPKSLATPTYTEPDPHRVNDPLGRPSINDRYGAGATGLGFDTSNEEVMETPKSSKKGGLLNRLKDRFERIFDDEIEDNEI